MQTELEQRQAGAPHDRIIADPAILGGRPVIRGTRIPVSLILNLVAHGYSFERVVEAYPILEIDDVIAALRFAEARVDDSRTVAPSAGHE